MLKKLSDILRYYDSEPVEILTGLVWLIFFPLIWSFQFKFQAVLVVISILLGGSLIKSTCAGALRIRKTLAYGSFLFSVVVIVLLFLNGGILNPSSWLWGLPLLMSIINLTTVTSQYYRTQNDSNGTV
jgi:hypothetical protein